MRQLKKGRDAMRRIQFTPVDSEEMQGRKEPKTVGGL